MEQLETREDAVALPSLLSEIVDKLSELYPNISKKIILNLLIVKIAQMMTSKRITIDESGRTNIPNWFTLIFLQSGGGKDRLTKDLEQFVFKDFQNWFEQQAEMHYQTQMAIYMNKDKEIEEIKNIADLKGGNENDTSKINPF